MKKAFHLIISFSLLFIMSAIAADTEPVNFSSTGTNPCSITINQDLTFTIPNAFYDAGPLVGQMALKVNFQFFGEQNGQLLWQLGNVDTSSTSASCSISIAPDLSFTLTDAVYDAGPLVGQMTLQADFQYSGEKNGVLLWYLADLKIDDAPSDPTPTSPVALSKTQVALESGNSETITISGGTGYYTVNTSNSQVATAVISGSSLGVTGLSSGSATITVSDTGGENASIWVTVSSPESNTEYSNTHITLAKSSFSVDEEIKLDWKNTPGNKTDWIAVVPQGSADTTWGIWWYTDGKMSGTKNLGMLKKGDYEVRVYYNWQGGGGYNVKSRLKFTVN